MCLGFGYASASYMGLAFHYTNNLAAQWRAPAGIAMVWPVFILSFLPWVPESPRFLLMRGRKEEAWKVVARLHGSSKDPEQVFAKEEFHQMQSQAEHDRELHTSWWQMFKQVSYRKRLILGCGLAALGQSTGVLVIQNYVSLIFADNFAFPRSNSLRDHCSTKRLASTPTSNSAFKPDGIPVSELPSPATPR